MISRSLGPAAGSMIGKGISPNAGFLKWWPLSQKWPKDREN
jgi:hypothetical protein